MSFRAVIPTRWLAYRIHEIALQRSQQECFVLYKHLCRASGLRSSAGCFFEAYVHEWFQEGGTFFANEIPIVNKTLPLLKLNIKRVEADSPNYFSTPETLLGQVKTRGGRGISDVAISNYFRPYARNYPSIDALMFCDKKSIILFQMTIAKHHDIKPHGVADLLKSLPMIIRNVYFVFVVPEECSSNYSREQKVPKAAEICSRRSNLQIKQFRLLFKDRDIQKVVVQGPAMQDEEDEEDEYDEYDDYPSE